MQCNPLRSLSTKTASCHTLCKMLNGCHAVWQGRSLGTQFMTGLWKFRRSFSYNNRRLLSLEAEITFSNAMETRY